MMPPEVIAMQQEQNRIINATLDVYSMNDPFMEMFVIYKWPRDYPDKFVVRRWLIGKTPGEPEADRDWFFLGDSLEEVRAQVPGWCVRLERDPRDEPHIVEVWI